ncbi:MAG: Hsp20/alpha crystallin family protein [Verrucomicrobiota bacterium]
MNLIRYDQTPLFNTRLESFLRDPFEALKDWPGFIAEDLRSETRSFLGALYEDEDGYHARFELPGWKKENVSLELHEDVLTVSCQRGEEDKKESLTRKVRVPEGLDADGVSATMEDGLLTIALPKAAATKPRKIDLS